MSDCDNVYKVGQGITVRGTFRLKPVAPATVGVLTDPTTVTVYIKGAGVATQTAYVFGVDAEVVQISTGIFELTYTPTEAGVFEYGWQGEGNIISFDEDKVRVKGISFTL